MGWYSFQRLRERLHTSYFIVLIFGHICIEVYAITHCVRCHMYDILPFVRYCTCDVPHRVRHWMYYLQYWAGWCMYDVPHSAEHHGKGDCVIVNISQNYVSTVGLLWLLDLMSNTQQPPRSISLSKTGFGQNEQDLSSFSKTVEEIILSAFWDV